MRGLGLEVVAGLAGHCFARQKTAQARPNSMFVSGHPAFLWRRGSSLPVIICGLFHPNSSCPLNSKTSSDDFRMGPGNCTAHAWDVARRCRALPRLPRTASCMLSWPSPAAKLTQAFTLNPQLCCFPAAGVRSRPRLPDPNLQTSYADAVEPR